MTLAAVSAISTYVKDEVRRQGFIPGSKEYDLRVVWMLAAWAYATSHKKEAITVPHLLEIGRLCEQTRNADGFRQVSVYVGGNAKMNWRLIPRAIDNLLTFQATLSPDSFYYEYETIHPFVDGNGRSGKVFYNWLAETLDEPIMPPNFWGSSNP